jgi:sec-independent protein translocase protein TatC
MTSPNDKSDSPGEIIMPFLGHLEELRWRLLKAVAAVIVCSITAFVFSDRIMRFVAAPLGKIKLHVTEVTGSFSAYLKVALIVGLIASAPIVFYQLWAFVSPGLYRNEKSRVLPLVVISTALFLLGAAFCWWLVLPIALQFLIGFSGDLLSPIITVGSYISFAGMLVLAFGLGFELPVIAYFLGRIGLISSHFLSRGRRYAIVIILIVAGVLTPTPDIATQLLLAVPLYILYEISIVIVRLTGKKEGKKAAEDNPYADGSGDQPGGKDLSG